MIYTWDNAFEASPADADFVAAGAGKIRDTRIAVRERFEVGHDKATGVHSTLTNLTLVTPALGTPASGNLNNCTQTAPQPIGETTPNTIRGLNKEILKTASADSPLTAAECSGTIVNNYGMTDADCLIALPTAAAGLGFLVVLGAARAKYFRLQAGATDKIYLNGVAGSDNGYVGIAAAVVGASISFFCFQTGAGAYDWYGVTVSGLWVAG